VTVLTLLCSGPSSDFVGELNYPSLHCYFWQVRRRLGLHRWWAWNHYPCPHRALRSWSHVEYLLVEIDLLQDVVAPERWQGRNGNSAEMQQRQHHTDPKRLVRPKHDMHRDTYSGWSGPKIVQLRGM